MICSSIEEKRLLAKCVAKVICDFFNINIEDVYKKNITKSVSKARSFIFYILHKDFNLSSKFLSFEFKRTTRTILHDCSTIGAYIKIYDDCRQNYDDICVLLEKAHESF